MTAILCATEMEAAPIIKRLNALEVADGDFPIYSFSQTPPVIEGYIIISGMGKTNAKKATEHICNRFDISQVVNIGICGALQRGLKGGELFSADQVYDGDRPEIASIGIQDSGRWQHLPSMSLLTVAEPVLDEERRDALAGRGAIVDMEGFAVAETCDKLNIPCEFLKGVSDQADGSGKDDIKKNINNVSSSLADVFLEGMKQIPKKNGLVTKLLNFIKLEHTIFSLPLLFSGAWIGAGGAMPELKILILVCLAGVGGRSLGMAMNRIMDRKIDALNARTAGRELPSGKLSLLQAYSVATAGFIVYMIACSGLGRICLILSPVPLIPLITYSLLKRFTSLCHYGIGVCLALAPLGAHVAASGSLDYNAEILLLALFTFCWISGYDIIYALQDMDSDVENAVHSIPAALGSTGAQLVAALTHAVAGGVLIWLWVLIGSGTLPLIALLIALSALCLGYLQSLPLSVRFFPMSAIAGIAGALIPLLGELS